MLFLSLICDFFSLIVISFLEHRHEMAAKYALKVGSRSIPLVASTDKINLQHVSDFKPLQDWAKGLEKEEADAAKVSSKEPPVVVTKIEVKNVEYFGSRTGFVNLSVDAKLTESGQKPPGLVFMVKDKTQEAIV